jgi:hypothetical protein
MFVAEPEQLDDLISKSDTLTTQELVDEIHKIGFEEGLSVDPAEVPEVTDLMKDLSLAISTTPVSTIKNYGDIVEGIVQRSSDLTPQQQSLNYTSSVNSALDNYSTASNVDVFYTASNMPILTFQPTQKELESLAKMSEIVEKPKRGRKPGKNTGKK